MSEGQGQFSCLHTLRTGFPTPTPAPLCCPDMVQGPFSKALELVRGRNSPSHSHNLYQPLMGEEGSEGRTSLLHPCHISNEKWERTPYNRCVTHTSAMLSTLGARPAFQSAAAGKGQLSVAGGKGQGVKGASLPHPHRHMTDKPTGLALLPRACSPR